MTDEITPALSATEWSDALRSADAATALLRRHVQEAAAPGAAPATSPGPETSAHLRAAIALANHLLPEGSRRKITWPMVDALRSALVVYHDAVGSTFGELGVRRHAWDAMADTTDVLASLLPPRDDEASRTG
jgi:hypothetical protein